MMKEGVGENQVKEGEDPELGLAMLNLRCLVDKVKTSK